MKTTLCYIERSDSFLMLYRNKKNNDPNAGKWIGIGGKLEAGEEPAECLIREVKEETGLVVNDYFYHGIIHFVSDVDENEDMYLYTVTDFSGEVNESCNEGTLKWVPKAEILGLNLWEGDPYFLKRIIEKKDRFSMTLEYVGGKLLNVTERDIFSCCSI